MPNTVTKKQSIEEFEADGSKNAAETKKKQKEKEKAEEDQQFVIDGAVIQCTSCMIPIGTLKVNFDTPTIQNKKTATVKEKSALSLKFSGNCLKSPKAELPCAAVMNLGEWQDVGTTLVQDQKPLIKKSTIMCSYGGSTIKFLKSGQINVPSVIEPVDSKEPRIIDFHWMDEQMENKITATHYDNKFRFYVQTRNVKEGETIEVTVSEIDGLDIKNGEKEILLSGIVGENGVAELKESLSILEIINK